MDYRPPRSLRYRQTQERPRPSSTRRNFREPAVETFLTDGPYRDNVKVSFTIMAHDKRREWAEQLADSIGCEVTWDRHNDRHETGIRAIESYDRDADYHVVVQDDVVLPGNFASLVTEALRWVPPSHPVGLYHGGTSGRHAHAWSAAEAAGASWLVRKGPIWGPAIAYPVDNISALSEHYRASGTQNYDRRVMEFYHGQGILCWYSVPSLVDHRQEGNPSLCGHDRDGRVARRFVGPQTGVELDWSGPIVRSRL